MKKVANLLLVLPMVSLLIMGCGKEEVTIEHKNNPDTDFLEKQCSLGATFYILEKSNIINQEGEKSYIIASEFQSEPILLAVGSDLYQTIEEGKSYYATFEGKLFIPNIEITLIPTSYAIPTLTINQFEEVESKGLENLQQSLICN